MKKVIIYSSDAVSEIMFHTKASVHYCPSVSFNMLKFVIRPLNVSDVGFNAVK